MVEFDSLEMAPGVSDLHGTNKRFKQFEKQLQYLDSRWTVDKS